MDFSTFDFGLNEKAKATETTIKLKLEHKGKPVQGPNGKQVEVEMLAPGSPEGTREARKWGLKWLSGVGDYSEATDEELAEALDREDEGGVDLAVRLVRGWNIATKEGEIACTPENRRGLFSAQPDLLTVMIAAYRAAGAKLGKSQAV